LNVGDKGVNHQVRHSIDGGLSPAAGHETVRWYSPDIAELDYARASHQDTLASRIAVVGVNRQRIKTVFIAHVNRDLAPNHRTISEHEVKHSAMQVEEIYVLCHRRSRQISRPMDLKIAISCDGEGPTKSIWVAAVVPFAIVFAAQKDLIHIIRSDADGGDVVNRRLGNKLPIALG